MMKLLSRLLLLFSLVSCYHSKPDPDFNMKMVLPADSMVTLLADMHIAEGIVHNIKDNQKNTGPVSTEYFEAILQRHGISREEFEESMRYYAYHTEELDKIYERVITDLSKKESLSHPEKEAEKPAE